MGIQSHGLRVAAGGLALCCAVHAGAATLSQQPVYFFDTETNDFGGSLPLGPAVIAGNTLVLIESQAGHNTAYVFVRDSGVWIETARLTSGDPHVNTNSFFEERVSAVAISPDGKTVFVGDQSVACAAHARLACGEVLVYEKPAAGWASTSTPDARLTPSAQSGQHLGANLAMSSDGSTLAAVAVDDPCPVTSNPQCESIYIYEKPAGGWGNAAQKAVLATGGSNSVASVRLSPSGDVAATDNQVFLKPVSGWTDAGAAGVILSSPASGFDSQMGDFGSLLHVSSDLILIGAPNINAALIYQMPGGGWATTNTATASLSPPASVSFFAVGGMVTMGSSVYVASDNGIYVYNKPAGGWANAAPDSVIALSSGIFGGVDSPSTLYTDGSQLFAEGYGSLACSMDCGIGTVLSSSPTTIISQSGLVIAGVSVDDLTDSKVRITRGPGGGVVQFQFDVENIAPGFPGTATFTATFPGKVTGADASCKVSGNTVTCPVSLSNGEGATFSVTDQLAVSAPSAHVHAALSDVTPASWDRVNGSFDYTLPVFFEPLVPAEPTTFQGRTGETISSKLPVTYGGKSALQFVVSRPPADGVLTVNAVSGAFTWKPPTGYMGETSFTYYVSDGVHTSGFGEVVLDETPQAASGKGGGDLGGFELLLLAGAWRLRRRTR